MANLTGNNVLDQINVSTAAGRAERSMDQALTPNVSQQMAIRHLNALAAGPYPISRLHRICALPDLAKDSARYVKSLIGPANLNF